MGVFRYVGTPALEAKARAALELAVGQAAEDLVGKAQDATPVDTGTLKASIHVAGISGGGTSITAKVATGGEANDYAIFVHEGTGPHVIRAKDGGVLAFNGVVARSVSHPGTPAFKFLERPLIMEAATYRAFLAAAARAAF